MLGIDSYLTHESDSEMNVHYILTHLKHVTTDIMFQGEDENKLDTDEVGWAPRTRTQQDYGNTTMNGLYIV